MRRISTAALLYFMLLNATAVVLDNVGFTEEMGVSVNLTTTQHLKDAEKAVDSFSLEGGFLETLFGIYDAAYSTMAAVLTSIYAGPQMLLDLGLPSAIVLPFTGVLVMIIGLDVIYYASGREP